MIKAGLLKSVAITYKTGRVIITGQKPITGKQAKHNIEMVYKNIKLTSSAMDYKAVLGVVNSCC